MDTEESKARTIKVTGNGAPLKGRRQGPRDREAEKAEVVEISSYPVPIWSEEIPTDLGYRPEATRQDHILDRDERLKLYFRNWLKMVSRKYRLPVETIREIIFSEEYKG